MLPELLAFLTTSVFIFYWSVVNKLPSGYAGLYSLMTEKLIRNGFRAPGFVPFYGPGGIPYAYPPAGFYLNAIFVTLLRIDQFTYLRFFPPIIAALTVLVTYWLIREMTGSRSLAIIASLLFFTSPEFLNLHVTSDGMVRGPAILFMMLGLHFAWELLNSEKMAYTSMLAAGLSLGLTAMSHLAYAEFLAVSIVILMLTGKGRFQTRLFQAGSIALIGLLVSAPWWLFVIKNFGFQPLFSAINSHSTLPNLARADPSSPSLGLPDFLWRLIELPFFYLVGIPYWLIKRDWQKALWLGVTAVFLGESARFLALIGSIAIADMFVFVSLKTQPAAIRKLLPAFLAVIFTLAFLLTGRLIEQVKKTPYLDADIVEMAAWLHQNTPADSKYLFISAQMDGANEWLPYLAQRTPTIGHWGSEWLGDYYQKHQIMQKMIQCAEKEAWDCIERVSQKYTSKPDYIVFMRQDFETLESKIETSEQWRPVFQDNAVIIYQNYR